VSGILVSVKDSVDISVDMRLANFGATNEMSNNTYQEDKFVREEGSCMKEGLYSVCRYEAET